MQKEKNSSLSEKEKLFCSFYVSTGNPYEAALKSGYRQKTADQSEKLICREDILKYIGELASKRRKMAEIKALCGYERLAFGSIKDALTLLFSDDQKALPLEELDLFNVSEIRRLKDGAVEIKFFNRLEALEKLQMLCSMQAGKAKPFYQALEESAMAVNKAFGEDA